MCYNDNVNTINTLLLKEVEIMEETASRDSVRSRLILSGLKELDSHGVTDFSLRRVAIDAGVSCAAPYRHFKDKSELISAIVAYVIDGWTLLSGQISELFSSDTRALISELTVSGLRFWIANGNFRTVLMTLGTESKAELSVFDAPIIFAIRKHCAECGRGDADLLSFKVISMLYGAILMVDGGYESAENAAESIKMAVLREI